VHPGQRAGEDPQQGDEPSREHSKRAAAFEERLGPLEAFRRVDPPEAANGHEPAPPAPSNQVAEVVTHDSADPGHHGHNHHAEATLRGEENPHQEGGLPGDGDAERFDADPEEDDEVRENAETGAEVEEELLDA
jgi:hypothetical protein